MGYKTRILVFLAFILLCSYARITIANYIVKCDAYNKQCFYHDLMEGDIFGVNFELFGAASKGSVNFEVWKFYPFICLDIRWNSPKSAFQCRRFKIWNLSF